jgi:hypothetical protein
MSPSVKVRFDPWIQQYAERRGCVPKVSRNIEKVIDELLKMPGMSVKTEPVIVAIAGTVEALLYTKRSIMRNLSEEELSHNPTAPEAELEKFQHKEIVVAAQWIAKAAGRRKPFFSRFLKNRVDPEEAREEMASILNQLDFQRFSHVHTRS